MTQSAARRESIRDGSASDPRPGQQLLLFADPLQRDGLVGWLASDPSAYRLVTTASELSGGPDLVIWALAQAPDSSALAGELQALRDRWEPAPLLLLLPARHPYSNEFVLRLPVQGVIQHPQREALREAVTVLLGGGRFLDLHEGTGQDQAPSGLEGSDQALGLGQWLLMSGVQQIDTELGRCRRLLQPPGPPLWQQIVLEGRMRELNAARQLLFWLWGPLSLAWSQPVNGATSLTPTPAPPDALSSPSRSSGEGRRTTSLTLRQRDADGIWQALLQRLQGGCSAVEDNHSGRLLAFDGLRSERRTDLLLALLEQFALLRRQLLEEKLTGEPLVDRWQERQQELRRLALRSMVGSYVQIPWQGALRPVAETLMGSSDLAVIDPELPDPLPMLATLIEGRPLLVEGMLLAPDEPRAVLHLELLMANWLLRSAELISSEILACCAAWPELRRYLLQPELLATRNLERLRNQLNSQQRWGSWFERPIRLYESRRELLCLEAGSIDTVAVTEPRDGELQHLSWPQQLVTLALEARDALAPQLQALLRRFGDLVVVVLTQVVGRAIGLVGRGIMQGMGRSLGRG